MSGLAGRPGRPDWPSATLVSYPDPRFPTAAESYIVAMLKTGSGYETTGKSILETHLPLLRAWIHVVFQERPRISSSSKPFFIFRFSIFLEYDLMVIWLIHFYDRMK